MLEGHLDSCVLAYDILLRMSECLLMECPVVSARTALAVKLFRGLSDPTRLTILQALRNGPLRVVDLSGITGRAQPNVSAHLACLRDCGLVIASPCGRETRYSLADDGMLSLLEATDGVLARIGPSLCSCPRYQP